MTCVIDDDPQLVRLAHAIAARVGQQRFRVWFDRSTRLTLRSEALEILVPNDFISEWIAGKYRRSIDEATHDVMGCTLPIKFQVMPQAFETDPDAPGQPATTPGTHEGAHADSAERNGNGNGTNGKRVNGKGPNGGHADAPYAEGGRNGTRSHNGAGSHSGSDSKARGADGSAYDGRPSNGTAGHSGNGLNGAANGHASKGPAANGHAVAEAQPARNGVPVMRQIDIRDGSIARTGPAGARRLRHDMESFVVGHSNRLAFDAANYVAEFPGSQYNPLFVHGACGLGKTHLLQALAKKFAGHHPARRFAYLTGEEFTNEFVFALRGSKVDAFRRKMRELDLLIIDDVHFLRGKKATQEEFLHTFNAIEATGKQIVMASDSHPKQIQEFGESLINRFVSGMVVRVDTPNFQMRVEILKRLARRHQLVLKDDVVEWIATRVTQNVRELEGALTRVAACVRLAGGAADLALAQSALADLNRPLTTPVRPETIIEAICNHFDLELRDLMSGRRQRTISLARSIAMFLIRKTSKLSFPDIAGKMGKRNHSTVISACRRIEKALAKNEMLTWSSSVGEREEEAVELINRLEEQIRAGS